MEIQTRVPSRRERQGISLPPIPEGHIDKQQPKLRGALTSLIENEKNYTDSLRILADIFQKVCASQTSSGTNAAEITHQKVEEILSIHQMFQIGLADALNDWYSNGSVGNSLNVFTTKWVIDIYSEYINNFEASMETMRAVTNPRRSIRGGVQRNRQKLLAQLSCNIVKPVQRFPQLIMIIKDLLKYTPRDHHDREALQEALTGIENVAYQLNERKRHNDQYRHGRMVMDKLQPKPKAREDGFLIREDNIDLLLENNAHEFHIEQRKVLLMNDEVLIVEVRKDSFTVSSCKYEYRWHQSLRSLQLTSSANILNRLTQLHANGVSGLGMDTDTGMYADIDLIVAEIEVVKHDIAVLEQTKQNLAKLKRSYKILDEIQDTISDLQDETKHLMYNMLQMLQAKYIFLYDIPRGRVFPFCVPNAKVKQEWCVDFIMARLAREYMNRPCWFSRERTDRQPALMLKDVRIMESQPEYQIKCAVRIHISFGKDSLTTEHLWVCSSSSTCGVVSIFPLHMDSSQPVTMFPVSQCDLVCAERVSYLDTSDQFVESVWLSTAQSEIMVFLLNQRNANMKPQMVLTPGSTVVSMVKAEGHVVCGTSSGHVLVYSRTQSDSVPQAWDITNRVDLSFGPVTSLIRIGEDVWAACGSKIYVLNKNNAQIQHRIPHRMDNPDLRIQLLVKAGVGVWASFHGSPNLVLFHRESRKVLQEISIVQATTKFLEEYPQAMSISGLEVTSLLVSLGLLWVGTNLGVILTYPLPRLRDGVPRINQRPHVALHGHNGPTRFLVPVRFDPVVQTPIFNPPGTPRGLDRSKSVKDKGIAHDTEYEQQTSQMDRTELKVISHQNIQVCIERNAENTASGNEDATTLKTVFNTSKDDTQKDTECVNNKGVDKPGDRHNSAEIETDQTIPFRRSASLRGKGESMNISSSTYRKTVVVASIKGDKICSKSKDNSTALNRRSASFTDIVNAVESDKNDFNSKSVMRKERISDSNNTAEQSDDTYIKTVYNGEKVNAESSETIGSNEDNLANIERSSDMAIDSMRNKKDSKNYFKYRVSPDNLTDFDVKEEKLDSLFGMLMKSETDEDSREDKIKLPNQTQSYKSKPLKDVDSHVIMVVSGGNGYKDMRKQQKEKNRSSDQNIDPTLILWMYKC